jgi:ABC-2 type transport system permease protein
MTDASVPAKVESPAARLNSEVSSISDLSYRSYNGPLKARFVRWWVVAQSGLRQTWGHGWFYLIAMLPLLRFLMAGFLMYIREQLAPGLPNYPGEPDGQRFADQFWSVLCGDTNSILLLIIGLVVGAGCIAADNRANALLVYFSKPIGKIDYLVGKWMSIFLTLLGVTLFPTAMLYCYSLISYRESGFFTSEPWLGPHLLLAVLVPAVIHSSLIVGISAWSKSPRIVSAIYTSLYILSGIVSFIVGHILYKSRPDMQNVIEHLSLRGLIIGISQNILHVTVSDARFGRGMPVNLVEMPRLWPLLTVAIVLVIGALAAAWIKIRAVEVVRG